jgi:hypothetical protein
MVGYHNYQAWLNTQRSAFSRFARGAVYVPGKAFGFKPLGSKEKREGLRDGPEMQYEQKPPSRT